MLRLPLGYLARQLARVLWLSLRLSLPLWPSLGDWLTSGLGRVAAAAGRAVADDLAD